MKEKGEKKNSCMWRMLLCMFWFACCMGMPMQADAGSGSTIRIGYYPLEGYHAKDALGNVSGYEVDYLARIAETTGWKYEYVEARSWLEAVRMLKAGEIDILSPADIEQDAEEGLEFSASNIGKTYAAVFTLENSKEYGYENFKQFDDMTFGICAAENYQDKFMKYASHNGFQPRSILFKTLEELTEALQSGKVDAIVTNIMRAGKDMRLIGKFGASAYYFVFREDADLIANKLNEALNDINTEFENELTTKYFPIFNNRPLTNKEEEYVKNLQTLKVGIPVNLEPIAYTDAQTGQIEGVTRDILERIAEESGLHFEYVALPSANISYAYLVEQGIDMVSCVEYNSINTNLRNFRLTDPYLTSQKVIVGRSGEHYKKEDEFRLSLLGGSQTFEQVVQAIYPNAKITLYGSIEECMDAVASGKEDALAQNQYTVERLLTKPLYEHLEVLPMTGIKDKHTLALVWQQKDSETADTVCDVHLVSVLNKAIYNMSEETVSEIVVEQTAKSAYKFTVGDFMYTYRYNILIILLVCTFGTIYIVHSYRQSKKAMRLLVSSENKFKSITNNMNGGVVLLAPEQGMPIQYANDGFLELVQYERAEYEALEDKKFVQFLYYEDAARLLSAAGENSIEGGRISLTVRMRRKDGTYIPIMYNSTYSRDEKGKSVLYGVVLDVSGEVSIMEKLQLEQKKHAIIMEKSEEIIYEIDVEHSEMKISDAFEKKFGWTFSENITVPDIDDMLSKWRVQEDDFPVLQKMFRNSLYNHEDVSCQVRIKDAFGNAKWCEISQYVMTDQNNRNLWFIGKITDIDAEVRERERLEAKTRYDSVTGLYNKEAFLRMGQEYLNKNQQKSSVVIFLDLDNFKNVNDTLGHIMGDKAIVETAKKLQEIFAKEGIVSRFGGDEFSILIKDITREALKDKLAEVLKKLQVTYTDGERSVLVSTSMGVVEVQKHGRNMKELLRYADNALYYVKEKGKNDYYILDKTAAPVG